MGAWWRGQGLLVTGCQGGLGAGRNLGLARSPCPTDSPEQAPSYTARDCFSPMAGFSFIQLYCAGKLKPPSGRRVSSSWPLQDWHQRKWTGRGPGNLGLCLRGARALVSLSHQGSAPVSTTLPSEETWSAATVRHTLLVAWVPGSISSTHYALGDAAGRLLASSSPPVSCSQAPLCPSPIAADPIRALAHTLSQTPADCRLGAPKLREAWGPLHCLNPSTGLLSCPRTEDSLLT